LINKNRTISVVYKLRAVGSRRATVWLYYSRWDFGVKENDCKDGACKGVTTILARTVLAKKGVWVRH
jgi:hypothetical protein